MNFSNKLFELRKEKGFSQETLAEQLNTTRQAISKWENDQGYPETETLLMIGNIFRVSIDYLLKDNVESYSEGEEGYYVSKEMIEGYLMHERRMSKYISMGISLIILSFIPYLLINQNPIVYTILIILFATLGVVIIISTLSTEKEKYKALKKEPLLIDKKYLEELTGKYKIIKKKSFVTMFLATLFIVGGLLPFVLESKNIVSGMLVPYYPVLIVIIAVGVYIFIRNLPIIESYKLLVENDVYVKKVSFKLKKKAREKIDDF